MSEALRQKTSARRVLLILAGLLAAVLALQGLASVGPGGYMAFAQDPTPTGSGRTIKIINPDETTSPEVSNKSDGVDTAYHLVAWVNNPQAGDVVEFKYIPDDQNTEISIICTETGTGQAAPVGEDTFECHWDLTNVTEGAESGTVRAILFANSASAATDEEAVTVDREGQTVEMTYPVNGGPIGFHTAPDGTTAGTIDFSTSAAGTPEGDEGTQDVIAYYSVAAPGNEPDFIQCSDGAHETEPGSADTVRCTLTPDNPDTAANEAHSPEQVTAVALVARDISEGDFLGDMCPEEPNPGNPICDEPDPDSADAHRALGYQQDPTTVTISPQTQQATPGACSGVITATVKDQNERKVVGANVDVHAQGPTDNLHFDDGGDTTSEHQPPEGGHTTEDAVDCTSEESPKPFSGTQGEHDQIGPNDVKHVESVAGGTDDNGDFKFQLGRADSGSTQFTAWADEDGNDRFCSEEAHGNGSIGWGSAAPSPTGVTAEDTSCPKPDASPTGTPTPTDTPTGTPTATSTETQPPGAARTVTLTSNKRRIHAGRRLTFSGRVLSNTPSCVDNEFVQIRRRVHGTNRFRDIFGTQTDAEGNYRVRRRANKGADYVAVVSATDQCAQASSDPVTVKVRVVLKILVSDTTPRRGDVILIKSSVRPQHDRTRLVLQRKKGRRWVRVATDRLNNRSIGRFRLRADFGRRVFRTKWPKQHQDHVAGTSRPVRVTTR